MKIGTPEWIRAAIALVDFSYTLSTHSIRNINDRNYHTQLERLKRYVTKKAELQCNLAIQEANRKYIPLFFEPGGTMSPPQNHNLNGNHN